MSGTGNQALNIEEFISSTHFVTRWSGVELKTYRRNISEHSFEVSALVQKFYLLNGIVEHYQEMYHTLEYALLHDYPEVLTGDVRLTTKLQYPELNRVLKTIDKAWFDDNLLSENKLSNNTKAIVKMCDIIVVALEIEREFTFTEFYTERLNSMFDNNYTSNPLRDKVKHLCEEFIKLCLPNFTRSGE